MFKNGLNPLYLTFPILLRKGIGNVRHIHWNGKECLESVVEYAMNENFENSNSILNQLRHKLWTKDESSDLIINLANFLSAGFDTVSHEMTNITYQLYKNPEVWIKLQKEVTEILNNKIENITKDSLDSFHFLNLFIKECQRIDGVATASFNQMAYQDFEVDGVKILKGTHIQYNIIGIHHNPQQY